MAGQAVDTGRMYGPTREDYERNKRENPEPTDTGVEHGPTRYDYNKKKEAEKIESNRQRIEDQQSKDYWKQQKKEHDDAERKKERREEARRKEEEKLKKNKRSWLGNRRPGIEIPKQGLHRLGYASRDLGGSITGAGSEGFGYADAFSMGGAESGLSLSLGNRRGRGVDFGSMSVEFGGLGEAMRSDGKARGFAAYRSPFARSEPAPAQRKGKGKKKSRKSRQGRGMGIMGFKLGLF